MDIGSVGVGNGVGKSIGSSMHVHAPPDIEQISSILMTPQHDTVSTVWQHDSI